MLQIFKRVNDILNANVNHLLDQIEDPERMIKQVILEMEEHITQSKEGVVNAIASEKQLYKELEQQRQQAATWQEKAELALNSGKEDLARSALMRKKEADRIVKDLEPAWESAKHTSESLKAQLQKLEQKLEEAKRKRTTLAARQHASEAKQQIYKTMNKLETGLNAQTKFDRMEDKVAAMEARTEALAELEDVSKLEQDFLELETDNEIEEELKKLKMKVGNTSSPQVSSIGKNKDTQNLL
jgi:phage shock protein A